MRTHNSGDTSSASSNSSIHQQKEEEDTDIETGNVKSIDNPKENDDEEEEDQDVGIVMDEFDQSNRIVTVIAAGESVFPLDQDCCKTRDVANGCAICLCEFDSGDQVTWAAYKQCPHVFHSDCILQWMLALGRKEQKRRRQNPDRSTGDPLKDVVTFPTLCPCCRQQFVSEEETSSVSETDSEEEALPERA